MKIKFKKLSDTAITPTKAHANDAGFDLYADENVTLQYGETKVIPTNIAIELPDGYMADVRPRSGLTLKTPLRVHYGTVDAGFRDGVGIIAENANHKAMTSFLNRRTDITINRGDKIAQLVIQKIPDIELIEVDELTDSVRGTNGFGSTGN